MFFNRHTSCMNLKSHKKHQELINTLQKTETENRPKIKIMSEHYSWFKNINMLPEN